MAQYIPKATLVAEIKNRRDSFYSLSESCEKGTPAKAGFYAQAQTLEGILSFIDTLEVKEMDLEKEMDRYYGMYRKNGKTYDIPDNEACFDWKNDELAEHEMRLAKHFFELGLKARKGE